MQQLRPASVRQASSIPRILKRHAPPRETARVAGPTNLYRHVRDPKPDPGIAPNLDDRGGRGNTALSPRTPYEGREKRAGMGGRRSLYCTSRAPARALGTVRTGSSRARVSAAYYGRPRSAVAPPRRE